MHNHFAPGRLGQALFLLLLKERDLAFEFCVLSLELGDLSTLFGVLFHGLADLVSNLLSGEAQNISDSVVVRLGMVILFCGR